MNLVKLMNNAWDNRVSLNFDTLKQRCVNLISHSYKGIYMSYYEYCQKYNKPFASKLIFLVYEFIFIDLMKCDDDFLQGEYDAYIKFCKFAQVAPKSADAIRSMPFSLDNTRKQIKFFNDMRNKGVISEDTYEAMVLGFCYLTLFGDRAIDEYEYYILRSFFNKSSDEYPSTWEQFKKEY